MKNKKPIRDVPEIQKDLAIVINELAALRRRLRFFQKETEQTPSYFQGQGYEVGELVTEPRDCRGWHVHGFVSHAISSLYDVALELDAARRLAIKENA